jgi:hypothetical protein
MRPRTGCRGKAAYEDAGQQMPEDLNPTNLR